GPLPVEVEAVEDAGRRAGPAGAAVVVDQVALDVEADAGLDKSRARRRGGGGGGEVRRPGPAAERDQHLEVGVLDLELLELPEVAVERLAPGVGDAVDALLGRH